MRTLNRKSEKNNQTKFDPFLSREKVTAMEERLKKLKEFSRPKAAEEVGRLAELGDFSENVEYQLAKGRLRGINSSILSLESQLKQAVIIALPKQFKTVQIGHSVRVEINQKQKTYRILGSLEADPAKGIVSHNSPIGSALLGRKVGDIIKIRPVDKEVEYRIINIKIN